MTFFNRQQQEMDWHYGYGMGEDLVNSPRGGYPRFYNNSPAAPSNWSEAKKFIGPVKPQAPKCPVWDQSRTSCSDLHELALHNRLIESYSTVEESCDHFLVELTIGAEKYRGSGPSLKTAKQMAASKALKETKYGSPGKKTGVRLRPLVGGGSTSTSQLHELATKKGQDVEFKFLEPYNFQFKPSMRLWNKEKILANYKVVLRVGGHEFYGQAELPQQAKHNAAVQAIPILQTYPDQPKVKTVISDGMLSGKNVVMALNETAMLNGLCPEWMMVGDQGMPHQKTFTWSLKLGEYEAVGTGCSKKVARNTAAQQMMAIIPEEWKKAVQEADFCKSKKKKGKKRPISEEESIVNSPGDLQERLLSPSSQGQPPAKRAMSSLDECKPIYEQITSTNPISSLYEFCNKARLPDPQFQCVSENVIESWQKGNQTLRKTEYTMKLVVKDKTYFESGTTKKIAKNKVATEAWNRIRAGID